MSKSKLEPAATTKTLPPPVRLAIDAAFDKKVFDVRVLVLLESDAFTDYFIICSATSVRQVRAIVDEIGKQLKVEDMPPSHIEGYDRGEWVLMDFFDFVVHVFTPETRRFYDLERLWGSAVRIDISELNQSNPPPS